MNSEALNTLKDGVSKTANDLATNAIKEHVPQDY